MKLTKPQRYMLIEAQAGNASPVDSYPPAKRLVELGLCEWVKVGFSEYLRITPAGLEALKETA